MRSRRFLHANRLAPHSGPLLWLALRAARRTCPAMSGPARQRKSPVRWGLSGPLAPLRRAPVRDRKPPLTRRRQRIQPQPESGGEIEAHAPPLTHDGLRQRWKRHDEKISNATSTTLKAPNAITPRSNKRVKLIMVSPDTRLPGGM